MAPQGQVQTCELVITFRELQLELAAPALTVCTATPASFRFAVSLCDPLPRPPSVAQEIGGEGAGVKKLSLPYAHISVKEKKA